MRLEDQMETLAGLGLHLNDNVSVEDVLFSWDRAAYEDKPFDRLLFTLGMEVEREPWGRFVSDCAWDLDPERIDGPGSYVEIVENLARIAGQANTVTEIADHVDFDADEAWVSYKINGTTRKHTADLTGDYADPDVVQNIMQDLEAPPRTFYAKDNGQASTWFYLTTDQAHALNELTQNALTARPRP